MNNNDKIPSMMIDGKLVDFSKLSIDELNELQEKLKEKQAGIRKELYGMLEE